MKTVQISSISLILLGVCCWSQASPPQRISREEFNKSAVKKIYMSPGRSTLIDFPCFITRASVGSSGDLEAKVATTSSRELDLWLKSDSSQTTNLIVRCQEEVFVFDIIPTNSSHQDYIKITSRFDGDRAAVQVYPVAGPQKSESQPKNSFLPPRRIEKTAPVLLHRVEITTDSMGRPQFEELREGEHK